MLKAYFGGDKGCICSHFDARSFRTRGGKAFACARTSLFIFLVLHEPLSPFLGFVLLDAFVFLFQVNESFGSMHGVLNGDQIFGANLVFEGRHVPQALFERFYHRSII